MKIGIVTYWSSSDNYGQILQCWALQEFLKKNGHKPFLIRYKRIVPIKRNLTLSKLFSSILQLPKFLKLRKIIRNQKIYFQTTKNELRKFEQFKEEYIDKTKIIYDEISIKKNPPKADLFICGSDQIWDEDGVYYLNFAPQNSIKIAYAVSLGGDVNHKSKKVKKIIYDWIKDFRFLGMREKNGVEFCKSLGCENTKDVVDPTLLLAKNDYEAIRISFPVSHPYLLLYLIGNPIDLNVKEVYEYADKRGLKVVYVAVQGQLDKYNKTLPQIGEWIDLVAHAELVITNSFHGTIFSLIYERPFVTIPLSHYVKEKNQRIFDLLEFSGLTHRIYNGNLIDCINSTCTFERFREFHKIKRVESKTKLLSNIV